MVIVRHVEFRLCMGCGGGYMGPFMHWTFRMTWTVFGLAGCHRLLQIQSGGDASKDHLALSLQERVTSSPSDKDSVCGSVTRPLSLKEGATASCDAFGRTAPVTQPRIDRITQCHDERELTQNDKYAATPPFLTSILLLACCRLFRNAAHAQSRKYVVSFTKRLILSTNQRV